MSKKWTHEELGEFSHDGVQWERGLEIPAFNTFSYKTGYEKINENQNLFKLSFYAEEDIDLPKDEAIKLALRVLRNQESLVDLLIDELWNDFQGNINKSGMWWNNSFDEAFEEIEVKPKTSKDLRKHLKFISLIIRNATEIDSKHPIAELAFHAEFDEEHGVGILTDGENIIGVGYMITARQYK